MNKKWLALWRHAVQTPNSHFQKRNTQGKAHRLLFQKVTDCMMFAGKVGRIIRILNDEPDDNLYFVIVSKSCENTKTPSIVYCSPWSQLAPPTSALPKTYPTGLWSRWAGRHQSCWLPVPQVPFLLSLDLR